jgi:hypothetical protein
MKVWGLYVLIATVCLSLLGAIILMIIKGSLYYNINIVELCSFLATIALAIVVVYLTKSLEKRDIARDMIAKDLLELCSTYESNVYILEKLEKGELGLDAARSEINMTFHRGDVITDMIFEELKESFPHFNHDIRNIATPYWKWLTGNDLQKDNFQISVSFQKQHETNLRKTITDIRIIIHKLIKQS